MSSDPIAALHPIFPLLREALPSLDGQDQAPGPDAGDDEGRVDAAVALILRPGSDLDLLLIRRAEMEGDPWSGQMALPGGRRDVSDEDLLHTALRETLEETGVRLDDHGVPLGSLEKTVPATRRLPPISIHPFVFGVPPGTTARVASREVDEVLWTPLALFQDPAALGEVAIHRAGGSQMFPCFRVEGRVVWGLTYRIITGFLEKLPPLPPIRP